MADDYLNRFLGDKITKDYIETSEVLPSWVDKSNASFPAYKMIHTLKQEKFRFIQGHGKKTDYNKKSNYEINKAEVAKKIDKTAQSIFHASSYSSELRRCLDDVNEKLAKAKDKKLERKAHGLQHLSKEELKSKTRSSTEELKLIKQSNCEKLYARLLSNMPLDVKRKLGL